MRVIPTAVPTIESLGAPQELSQVAGLADGLALVVGPRGCGKSSTLAALVDHINVVNACHIVTIEDPIEFLHNHKQATVHQRELHSDTPSVSHAMRAALRQVPNVIAVGELKERETIELTLDAAESGHVVLSTLTVLNPEKAIERLVAAFPNHEQSSARERLARVLRFISASACCLANRMGSGSPYSSSVIFHPLLILRCRNKPRCAASNPGPSTAKSNALRGKASFP
jgi:twitching motility protein PilT